MSVRNGSETGLAFLSGANIVEVSVANPLPITGAISATNPSVGTTGTTAPTSATEVGIISGGNLVGVSAANPLPITGTLIAGPNYNSAGSQPITTSTGTAIIACQSFTSLIVEITGTYSGGVVVFEQQVQPSGAYYPCFGNPIVTPQTALVAGATLATNASVAYQFTVGASINFRVRATGLSTGTMNVFMAETTDALQYGENLALETGGNLATVAGSVLSQAAATSGQKGGLILAQARSTEITPYTTAQSNPPVMDLAGKLISMPYANKENVVFGSATVTGTSDTSVIAAGAGSLKNYVTGGTVYNTGATTSTITVKNGSGGTTLFTTIAPAGGGSNFTLPTPIPTSAATAVYFAAGSSSTTIGISLTGYTGT